MDDAYVLPSVFFDMLNGAIELGSPRAESHRMPVAIFMGDFQVETEHFVVPRGRDLNTTGGWLLQSETTSRNRQSK